MGRNVRGYPGLFSPNRTTCNHNRSLRNENDRTRLSKLQKINNKWWSGRSSMAIIPGPEKYNILPLLQTFQLWICTIAQHLIPLLSAGTTLVPTFWSRRYLVREKVLNEGCYCFIYWVLCRCPLNPLLERSWRHLFGPHFCNITDFYH